MWCWIYYFYLPDSALCCRTLTCLDFISKFPFHLVMAMKNTGRRSEARRRARHRYIFSRFPLCRITAGCMGHWAQSEDSCHPDLCTEHFISLGWVTIPNPCLFSHWVGPNTLVTTPWILHYLFGFPIPSPYFYKLSLYWTIPKLLNWSVPSIFFLGPWLVCKIKFYILWSF